MPAFSDLPDQAVEHILAQLSVVDLARAAGTCTAFCDESRRRTAALRRELRRFVDAAWWADTTQAQSTEVPGIVWATYPDTGSGPAIVVAPWWPAHGYPHDLGIGPRPTPWLKAQLVVAPVAIRRRKLVFHGFTYEAGFERTDVPVPNDSIAAALTYFMWLSRRPDLHKLLLLAV